MRGKFGRPGCRGRRWLPGRIGLIRWTQVAPENHTKSLHAAPGHRHGSGHAAPQLQTYPGPRVACGCAILLRVMRPHLLALLPLLLFAACGGDSSPSGPPPPPARYSATDSTLLSAASPTKDEDPSVILAKDGSIVVAWFSDRGGNSDIYVARCTGGTTWSAPVRVTVNADGDFYPNLHQDARGVFHLTWFRWYALNRGHIWYNRSIDPLVWDPANEVQVTTIADVDDWVPSIAETPDSLRIFFVSEVRNASNTTNDIYYASSAIDTVAWGPARAFPNNSPFAHDHLPFAAWTGTQLDLVWVRHDTSQPSPWLVCSFVSRVMRQLASALPPEINQTLGSLRALLRTWSISSGCIAISSRG